MPSGTAVRDRTARLAGRRAGEERVDGGRGDGLRAGDLAEDGDEAGAAGQAAEPEVGPDDRRARSGSATGAGCCPGRSSRSARRTARSTARRTGPGVASGLPWATDGSGGRRRGGHAAERPAAAAAGGDERARSPAATVTRRDGRWRFMVGPSVSVRFIGRQPRRARIAAASPSGNGWVTGRTSSIARPPPSRFVARSRPPSSAACSAAIARPRPLPPRRLGSAM